MDYEKFALPETRFLKETGFLKYRSGPTACYILKLLLLKGNRGAMEKILLMAIYLPNCQQLLLGRLNQLHPSRLLIIPGKY